MQRGPEPRNMAQEAGTGSSNTLLHLLPASCSLTNFPCFTSHFHDAALDNLRVDASQAELLAYF